MNFSQSSFQSLTTLALLDESRLDCSDEQWQMFIIKCFSVNLWLFTSITLDYILKIIPNLEEFRLSMLNVFRDSADDSYEMQVPKTFKKLHLEFKYEYQLGFEQCRAFIHDVLLNVDYSDISNFKSKHIKQ
jgi:hypothetical protein